MTAQGTLSAWSSAANMLFAYGCEAQSFAVLASLAAPLMPLWRARHVGAVVSIFGGKKSGKSTAVAGARSVWGGETCCELPSDTQPMIAENFINRDPVLARAMFETYILNAKDHAPVFISASGMSLFAALATPERPFRLGVEFEVKVPSGLIAARDKNEIEFALYANAGHAGPMIEAELANEKAQHSTRRLMRSYLSGMEESACDLSKPLDPNRKKGPLQSFQMIATARAAGDIAVRLKLLEIDPERIARWAFAQYGGPE